LQRGSTPLQAANDDDDDVERPPLLELDAAVGASSLGQQTTA